MDSLFWRPKKNATGGHAGSGTSLSSQDSGRPASLHYGSGNVEEDDSGGSMDHIAYKDIVSNLNERQLDENFEEMLVSLNLFLFDNLLINSINFVNWVFLCGNFQTNMNLSEEKKEPLRAYNTNQKRSMLIAYKGVNSHVRLNYILYLFECEYFLYILIWLCFRKEDRNSKNLQII